MRHCTEIAFGGWKEIPMQIAAEKLDEIWIENKSNGLKSKSDRWRSHLPQPRLAANKLISRGSWTRKLFHSYVAATHNSRFINKGWQLNLIMQISGEQILPSIAERRMSNDAITEGRMKISSIGEWITLLLCKSLNGQKLTSDRVSQKQFS